MSDEVKCRYDGCDGVIDLMHYSYMSVKFDTINGNIVIILNCHICNNSFEYSVPYIEFESIT